MLAGALAAAGAQQPAPPRTVLQEPAAAEQVILAQLAAFNAGDVETMVANVAEDFVWFAVEANYTEPRLRGREAFRTSMLQYFAAVPSARAEVEAIFPVGGFVAVRERAYWAEGSQQLSQASLAVYEVRDGLIRRVWYYPVEP